MNNLYIKFSLLILFLCLLSGSVFAQGNGNGNGNGGFSNVTTDINITHPMCTTCEDGKIDVEWTLSGGNVTDLRVLLYDSSGSLVHRENISPYNFTGLGIGDYTVIYQYYKSGWEDYARETAVLGVCSPSVYYNDEYISNVLIGDINNDSDSDGYTDYTIFPLITTEVVIGINYNLTVTVDNYDDDYYSVWVDWNHDFDFDDDGETIVLNELDGNPVFTTIISPPTGAVTGDTRIRVRVSYASTTACNDSSYGEVEDYTLNVKAIANADPEISDFEPKVANANISTNITIYGENLDGASEVKIGNIIATIISNTATEITVNLPNVTTACNGAISVTKAGASGLSSDDFTVNSLCAEGMEEIKLTDVTGECSATVNAPKITDACAGEITGTTSDPLTYTTQGTHVIIWAFDYGIGIGTEARPFTSLGAARSVSASGRYYFNLGNGKFQADVDNSEGGGWVLILQYHHRGGTNPDLSVIGSGSDLPVANNAGLGVDLYGTTSWGHAGNACLSDMTGAEELRWYAETSHHDRIIHFKSPEGIDYALTGAGSFASIRSNFTLLSGHNAQLPEEADNGYFEKGNEALTNFPIYNGGDYHWGIKGRGDRWEVDDYPSHDIPTHESDYYSTIHKMWIRGSSAPLGNVVTVTQKVIIEDKTPPEVICQNTTAYLDVNGIATVTTDMIDNGSTDNCEIAEITLDKPELSSIGDNTVKLTVTDKSGNYSSCDAIVSVEEMPKLSLSPVSIDEGAGVAVVKARLNKVSSKDISFRWCADDDISAGNSATKGDDYDGVGWDTVEIPAGESSVDLKISIYEDSQYEGDEVFIVFFNSAVNAISVGNRVICTIVDNDDPLPSLSISDISVDEGAGVAVFEVRLNKLSLKDVSFSWLTVDNTAFAPEDYGRKDWADAVIPAGQLSVDLEVTIVDDTEYEPSPDEKFICDIANASNASITKSRGYCEIVDNENTASIEINTQDVSVGTIPDSLVQNVLVTGCLIAENIAYTGDQINGIGYFEKGDSDFPLSSGVILSTGNVENAIGPASNHTSDHNTGFDFIENNKDSDLVALAGTKNVYKQWWNGSYYYWGWGWDKAYYDTQILEFDFIPAGNKLEFNYIFASEEYNGYACSNFNDGFAFILSGPGITNDTGLSGQNIALTESGDQVSINNVYKKQCKDCPDNSEFYVEEIGGHSIAFDGRTKILTAKADVTSCETYHIKLIVYDRNDKGYNSAVFLEAKSFKSNEVIVENRIDGIDGDKEVMYRGCDKSYISFTRKEGIDKEYPFHITISGSAVNGVDYHQVLDDGTLGKFPEDVSFAVGQEEIKIFYMASDEVTGLKDILFEVLKGCPCSTDADDYFKKSIDIIDVARIGAKAISNVRCNGGDPVSSIIIQLEDALVSTNYLYSLDGGVFQEDNKFQGAFAVGDHVVTIKDKFSCSSEDITINIPAATDLKANAGVDFEMCEKVSTKTLNGTGGIDYLWTCDKPAGLNDMNVTSSAPNISSDLIADTYTYILTVSDGISGLCESSDEVVITVKQTPAIDDLYPDKFEVCSGQEIILTARVSNVISPSYEWTPDTEISGSSDGLSIKAQLVADGLEPEPRTFAFKVTSGNSCFANQSVSGIKVYPNPKISLIDATSNLCADGSSGELHIEATGGTPNNSAPLYNYEWSHNSTLNSPNALSLPAGDYQVKVSDVKACFSEADFTVNPKPQPKGIFHD